MGWMDVDAKYLITHVDTVFIDIVYERVELLSCDVGVAQAPPIIHVYGNTGMVFYRYYLQYGQI